MDLFKDKKKTKIEQFEENVREAILSGEITNNGQMLRFTYAQGHIPKHASDTLKKMKGKKKIHYEGTSPCVTYEKVYRDKRKVEFKVIKT